MIVKSPFITMGTQVKKDEYGVASDDVQIQVPAGAEMTLSWNNGYDILVYIAFDGLVYMSHDRELLSYFGASL